MAQNVRRAAPGRATPLENVFVGTNDAFQLAPKPLEIQMQRLVRRFGITESHAAIVAELAFGHADDWRRRA